MSAPQTFLVMAGGTGGHVYPALAVARELMQRGHRVEWVGTRRGLEARVVPAADIKLHTLAVRGVRGKNVLHTLWGVLALAWSQLQALGLLLRLRPGCVLGMGGYAAGPAGLAAWLLRRPLVVHEQNAVAGTTNRLLAPLAQRVIAGFAGAFKDRRDVLVLGNPVRAELLAAGERKQWNYDGSRPLRLLIVGGSLGAKPINDLLPPVIHALRQQRGEVVEVLHQTGSAQAAAVAEQYGALHNAGVRVQPFIEDMAEAYSWADLVLCRAGALTVAELAVMGLPSLLIPLPHAIDDHQTGNARSLTDRGAGLLLRQSELSAESLVKTLLGYIDQPRGLADMARAARQAALPEATRRVADCCEEVAR
ncbi:undecaprenyldiphospho-muramoylpentapeptide beta-N-acetylglucosaminyltransferase [Parahaliea aestuarii]|uniref:UDP-N-acetylglucosamine--N-acetylmuramyl-(pentapeptide) pyrophosphoryl-undecaprenol N-acetylglucosamine transferase n=1 Tax=Parahaliea aestuarii TaxID=1852021 RepID=A0A5C9A4N8_9GAMM|nr:undecaprenyldiphospho-muramoylpentapeptide beta-N-acetylglucosaminyltransferase [Parahaliea aestuarii]TXS94942.1 undecaprenyldiphospho-muramoylpentapeptide beta-N-acetylglucosaminyltransferase [Parahaliea aestuarii]